MSISKKLPGLIDRKFKLIYELLDYITHSVYREYKMSSIVQEKERAARSALQDYERYIKADLIEQTSNARKT